MLYSSHKVLELHISFRTSAIQVTNRAGYLIERALTSLKIPQHAKHVVVINGRNSGWKELGGYLLRRVFSEEMVLAPMASSALWKFCCSEDTGVLPAYDVECEAMIRLTFSG